MAACRALMYLNFRISTSHIPYDMREAELGSHPVAGKRRLSSDPILWFGPRRSPILPSRPPRYECRRAQRRSMMALQRHRRLVIDGREHDGILVRHGTSPRRSTRRPIDYVERRALKLRAPAQQCSKLAVL